MLDMLTGYVKDMIEALPTRNPGSSSHSVCFQDCKWFAQHILEDLIVPYC